ncbi:TlpA disulfide reductase family protein [Dactylosporangium sp. NPDC051485]|uniref:TlpA family protein disulfide reductase n=1 Tax=Dactylosporangium sp. NPDC051485 TaxID=3154846 RepID=UPI003422D3CE
MPFLVAAVALVGLLCLLDLLLTVGVVRRLREHTEQLALLAAGAGGGGGALPVGATVPAFEAVSTAGERIALDDPDGTVVGFFSTTCAPCEQMLPDFVDYAASLPGGRSRVVAVLVGEEGEGSVKAAALAGVSRVVTEPRPGALAAAFGTSTFPTVYVVSPDRSIVVSGHGMEALRNPVLPAGVAG